jgi:large repetitive protein
MNARFDEAVWAGLDRRLAAVEALIPDPPPWTQTADTVAAGRVRAGTAFGTSGARPASRRRQLVRVLAVVAALLALLAVALLVGAPREFVDRRDEPFGPWGIHRSSDAGGSAAVLPDGRVLIASGTWEQMGTVVGSGMDIWDPAQGRVATGPAGIGRIGSAATLLLDGRVLVTGGYGGPYAYASSSLASAELWDPRSGAFAATGSMLEERVNHTATLLPDGRVLVIGGGGREGPTASAEVWNPATGNFTSAGRLIGSAGHRTATLLPSGDVLILGDGPGQLWRMATEAFTPAHDLPPGVDITSATALLDGRLLVIGTQSGRPLAPPAAFIVSVGSGFSRVGELLDGRLRYATTLLADGRVLITGGVDASGEDLRSAELWDPVTGNATPAPSLARAVSGHAALLLTDGRVLIVPDVVGPEGTTQPLVYQPTKEGDR